MKKRMNTWLRIAILMVMFFTIGITTAKCQITAQLQSGIINSTQEYKDNEGNSVYYGVGLNYSDSVYQDMGIRIQGYVNRIHWEDNYYEFPQSKDPNYQAGLRFVGFANYNIVNPYAGLQFDILSTRLQAPQLHFITGIEWKYRVHEDLSFSLITEAMYVLADKTAERGFISPDNNPTNINLNVAFCATFTLSRQRDRELIWY